jgi:2-isopropylmalate synthase
MERRLMESLNEHDLIYDWNVHDGVWKPGKAIEFDDETLRDGLQSPSVTDPPIEDKIRMLYYMHQLGI